MVNRGDKMNVFQSSWRYSGDNNMINEWRWQRQPETAVKISMRDTNISLRSISAALLFSWTSLTLDDASFHTISWERHAFITTLDFVFSSQDNWRKCWITIQETEIWTACVEERMWWQTHPKDMPVFLVNAIRRSLQLTFVPESSYASSVLREWWWRWWWDDDCVV